MKIFLKFEKTFIFIIKLTMFLLLAIIFFFFLSQIVPQIKNVNRTSVISMCTFLASLCTAIRIYGGFPVGKKHTSDIRNYAILGTFIGDIITFITIHIMSASSSNYFEFSAEFIENANLEYVVQPKFSTFLGFYFKNKVLPSLIFLALAFFVQIIIICIFARFSNTLYFKINKPQKTIIIYEKTKDLPALVSKIKKNPFRWEITELVKYNSEKILQKIQRNEAMFFSNIPHKERAFLIEYCYKHNKNIYIHPTVSDIIVYSSSSLTVDDSTVLSSTDCSMSFEQLFLKRSVDIVFSILAIILTSPIMLAAAIAIKLYDNGPIIFKQKRLTIRGKKFNLLKFRSMIVSADENRATTIAEKNDPRITPVGKFLRRFRIDELPQFLNILKGDLSVVGPRPERLEHVEKFEKVLPEFRYRLKVKAGLTGLAQIRSKYNTTPKDKLTLDLSYIQKYSLWLDLKIILCTLIIFLKPDSTEGIKKIDDETIKFVNKKLKNSK